jgi:hypothetical protein
MSNNKHRDYGGSSGTGITSNSQKLFLPDQNEAPGEQDHQSSKDNKQSSQSDKTTLESPPVDASGCTPAIQLPN